MQSSNSKSAGFTLTELLVILCLLALGSAIMAPALARTQPNSRSFQCLHNARQLAAAISMYCADNTDLYPPNPDDGNTTPGYNWCPGFARTGQANAFDPQILRDPTRCLVALYLAGNAEVFRCPADTRQGLANGETLKLPGMAGKNIPCARSVSMNGGIGTADASWISSNTHSGKPKLAVPGTWLTGSATHTQTTWATFSKATDFRTATPSKIFLVAEEDPHSINDGAFGVIASVAQWVDLPASFHNHGSTFSFCDGHAEAHKWTGNNLIPTSDVLTTRSAGTGPDRADWAWVKDHATQLLQ